MGYLSQSLKSNTFVIRDDFAKLIHITISELLRKPYFDVGATQGYVCVRARARARAHTHTHTHTRALKCKFDILSRCL